MVEMEQFFPIHLSYYDSGEWCSEPRGFAKLFHDVRTPGKTWSTYSVVIKSPNEITFKVYLTERINWPVGRELVHQYDIDVTLHADEDLATVREYIEKRAVKLARTIREQELLAREELIISGYAAKILKELNLK